MTHTPSLPTEVTTALERLVAAAARDEPVPTLAPEQTAALADALERAVLDRSYLEAYLARLLDLWEGKPPAAELLEDRHLPRVREEGAKAIPAGRLARLAVEPTAVLDLRDAVHTDVLPTYWSDRLREFNPRVDQLRDDFLRKPAESPGEDVRDDGLTYTIPPRVEHPLDSRLASSHARVRPARGGDRLPEEHVEILEVYSPGLLDRPGDPGAKPVEGAAGNDQPGRGTSPDPEPSGVNAGRLRDGPDHSVGKK